MRLTVYFFHQSNSTRIGDVLNGAYLFGFCLFDYLDEITRVSLVILNTSHDIITADGVSGGESLGVLVFK